jgi:hypothetical protein
MVYGDWGPMGTHVELLMTHPGVHGCGGTMLEWVLAAARQSRWKEWVYLTPIDEAREAYAKLGFVQPEPRCIDLVLRPEDVPAVWKRAGGVWKLAAFEGQDYYLGDS